ncbi:MAG TPA: HD-GYP domain-containing protein [bacterium]|jgi:HD-GYP domain-containing protein (c-di-GMP phosphodiesterase class II)|nr:HD-GYP domain-containing protein [bacterium]
MALPDRATTLPRGRWANVSRLLLLAAPTALLVLLLRNPALDPPLPAPIFHFEIVTIIAAIGGVLAALMMVVAERLQEPRGFFLALGFGAIAGFFFIHGFLTPGVIFEQASHGIHWAPLVGFALAGVCLVLSAARPRPQGDPWIHRRRRAAGLALLAMWVGFLVLSVKAPDFLEGQSATAAASIRAWHRAAGHEDHDPSSHGFAEQLMAQWRGSSPGSEADRMGEATGMYEEASGRPWIAVIVMLFAGTAMGAAVLRYARQYRLSQLSSHLTIVWSVALLLQSLLAFFFASVWRVSWWEYHVLALCGVGTMAYGLVIDYRRGPGIEKALAALLARGSVRTLEESYTEVLTGLTAAIEARDPYTKGHSEKVARLAASMGERMGLAPEMVRGLYQAGLMHDVGKMAIPDAILNKESSLTAEEFEIVKGHPARSEDIVARVPSLRPLRWAIRWHHERLDGSGYPDGLKGTEIPLEAHILAVADVFDAMTSGRAYRPAIAQADALDWLDQRSGTMFDPQCLEILRQVIGPVPAAARSAVRLIPAREGR